jgi:hypothetical protein
MMMLIAAAAAAVQPAPAPTPQGQMPDMQHKQHEGMKENCSDCCKHMGEGEHGMHAPDAHFKRGE